MLVFVEMRRQIDWLFRRPELLHDKRDVFGALWDKAWRVPKDRENAYVDRMRLMRVARGSGDIHLCRGRLGEYLIR
jgi:hypothetical protein